MPLDAHCTPPRLLLHRPGRRCDLKPSRHFEGAAGAWSGGAPGPKALVLGSLCPLVRPGAQPPLPAAVTISSDDPGSSSPGGRPLHRSTSGDRTAAVARVGERAISRARPLARPLAHARIAPWCCWVYERWPMGMGSIVMFFKGQRPNRGLDPTDPWSSPQGGGEGHEGPQPEGRRGARPPRPPSASPPARPPAARGGPMQPGLLPATVGRKPRRARGPGAGRAWQLLKVAWPPVNLALVLLLAARRALFAGPAGARYGGGCGLEEEVRAPADGGVPEAAAESARIAHGCLRGVGRAARSGPGAERLPGAPGRTPGLTRRNPPRRRRANWTAAATGSAGAGRAGASPGGAAGTARSGGARTGARATARAGRARACARGSGRGSTAASRWPSCWSRRR